MNRALLLLQSRVGLPPKSEGVLLAVCFYLLATEQINKGLSVTSFCFLLALSLNLSQQFLLLEKIRQRKEDNTINSLKFLKFPFLLRYF